MVVKLRCASKIPMFEINLGIVEQRKLPISEFIPHQHDYVGKEN